MRTPFTKYALAGALALSLAAGVGDDVGHWAENGGKLLAGGLRHGGHATNCQQQGLRRETFASGFDAA